LPTPGGPEHQQRVAVGYPAAGGEVADLARVERRQGGEVEAFERAHERELRDP
jgi:hypothetical protein